MDTRLRKLDAGEYDALVLAAAGLRRLGVDSRISATLPLDVCVPAPGQGIIAVEIRAGDDETRGTRAARCTIPAAARRCGGARAGRGARRRLSAAARRHRGALTATSSRCRRS